MQIERQLIEWASVNSYSQNREGLDGMTKLAKEAFSLLQPDEVKLLPFGLSLTKRKAAPLHLFLGGHLDTVFPPDHPFQKVEKLDKKRLRGPGVADMKGGLLVMLHALLNFESTAEAKRVGWEIFLNLDEEIGSPNSTAFLQECAKRCHYALIFEPPLPDGAFVSARRGSATYRACSHGKSAHAGRHPEEGQNAIVPLAHFICSLEELNNRDTYVNVGMIKGGGPLNIIPNYAEAGINVRFRNEVESAIIEHAQAMGISIERLSYRPPKLFDAKTEALFTLLKACGQELGQEIRWRETGGVCDGNTFGAAGVPTIDTLGVVGRGIHTDEEFIYIASLEEKIALTTKLLTELARGANNE